MKGASKVKQNEIRRKADYRESKTGMSNPASPLVN